MATLDRFLYGFGAIASITCLLIILVTGSGVEAIIALAVIVVFQALLLWKVFSTINAILGQRYSDGYTVISQFANFSTEDGAHYIYELYKHIQSKQVFMSKYEHGFNWSGGKYPKITSGLQKKVGSVIKTPEGSYDRVPLHFKKPLFYNQIEVVHLHMKLDDSDDKASPFIDFKVLHHIKVIRWNVELRHKTENPPAKVYRRRIQSDTPQDYEDITSVPFDTISRSYLHHELMPEVGYYYRLQWDK